MTGLARRPEPPYLAQLRAGGRTCSCEHHALTEAVLDETSLASAASANWAQAQPRVAARASPAAIELRRRRRRLAVDLYRSAMSNMTNDT